MPLPSRRLGRRLLPALAALLALTAMALPQGNADDQPFRVQLVRVHTPDFAAKDKLTNLGLDLTEHGGEDYVEVVLHSPADAARLVQNGFTWDVRIPDLAARQARNNQINRAYAASTLNSGLPSGRTGYRSLADYNADLAKLANDHPGLVRRIELSRRSLENRPIYGVEIAKDVASTTDGRPTFLLMGLHHAREWPSGEHAIEFAFDLARNFGTDPRITSLLSRARVLVVPVVNVDGFEQSFKWGATVDLREHDDGGTVSIAGTPGNAYKRKNCRPHDGRKPVAAECESPSNVGFGIGVDLNRNYGGLWGGDGASTLAADPTYRGAAPFSEPETQAVRELIASRHVTLLISNHTFSNLVLRPPGVRSVGETADEPAMREIGARMTAQNGYRNIHGWELYDTTGTTEDWSYNATGGYGYTFEIGPTEFHPPYPDVVDEYRGAGFYAGKGNREAYLIALATAADKAHHSMLTGTAPPGALLRLKKSFATKTSQVDEFGTPRVIYDELESTMNVPASGRFNWHVNPSTRPEVMEHRLRVFADEPRRKQVWEPTQTWVPGDHVDIVFSVPETDAGGLIVDLDWATPDDLDLEVYWRNPNTGELVEVGGSGNFVNEKERALVDRPLAGDYVLRVVNYASVSPTFRLTAGLYDVAREDAFGEYLVETYTLSCERPDGTVLERRKLAVDRGRVLGLNLRACLEQYAA